MTATIDSELAAADHALQTDRKEMERVLRVRIKALCREHPHLLPLARELIRELFVLNAAIVMDEDMADCDAIGAVAMTLDDLRLLTDLPARVAKVRATLAADAVQQRVTYPDGMPPIVEEALPTGRG